MHVYSVFSSYPYSIPFSEFFQPPLMFLNFFRGAMFIVALFTTTGKWNYPRCHLTDE